MDMADTYEAWLKQMEAKSRAQQNDFMNDIAKKLKRPRVTEAPNHPFRGAPDFWKAYELTEEERVERFAANFKAASGFVERLSDMEAAKQFITDKAAEMSAHYIIRQNQPELNEMAIEEALPDAEVSVWNSDSEEHWKARAAEADFGIVVADHAAAYTGSVTVLSAAHKGRSVSLLPTVLFVIVPLERLKTRLGEILIGFDEAGREQLPAGIHFISGPSRSSDIENALTIGVHGPGVVYALIVG